MRRVVCPRSETSGYIFKCLKGRVHVGVDGYGTFYRHAVPPRYTERNAEWNRRGLLDRPDGSIITNPFNENTYVSY